jgi:hypothetical protein
MSVGLKKKLNTMLFFVDGLLLDTTRLPHHELPIQLFQNRILSIVL